MKDVSVVTLTTEMTVVTGVADFGAKISRTGYDDQRRICPSLGAKIVNVSMSVARFVVPATRVTLCR